MEERGTIVRGTLLNRASLVARRVKNLPAMQETGVQSLGQEDPLEEGMATHSSILAQRIPWTEEPGRLHSMGSKELDKTEQLTLSLFKVRVITEFSATFSWNILIILITTIIIVICYHQRYRAFDW